MTKFSNMKVFEDMERVMIPSIEKRLREITSTMEKFGSAPFLDRNSFTKQPKLNKIKKIYE
jgi:hypothetical protein